MAAMLRSFQISFSLKRWLAGVLAFLVLAAAISHVSDAGLQLGSSPDDVVLTADANEPIARHHDGGTPQCVTVGNCQAPALPETATLTQGFAAVAPSSVELPLPAGIDVSPASPPPKPSA